MKLAKLRKMGVVIGSVLLLWFVIFEWHFLPYSSRDTYNEGVICYSPNHEYYIKRYQTIYESGFDPLYTKGIAILYNKNGKRLYKGTAYLSEMFGPHWDGNVVFFEGAGENFYTHLPSSSGEHPEGGVFRKGCF